MAASPDEYDAATRVRPAECPLFALAGDSRAGRRLVEDLARDRSSPPPPALVIFGRRARFVLGRMQCGQAFCYLHG